MKKIFFLHVHVTYGGHVTSSIQLEMTHYDCTEEQMEYLLQEIKGKTIATIVDSKHNACISMETLANRNCSCSLCLWHLRIVL